jgi:hypothetical protein
MKIETHSCDGTCMLCDLGVPRVLATVTVPAGATGDLGPTAEPMILRRLGKGEKPKPEDTVVQLVGGKTSSDDGFYVWEPPRATAPDIVRVVCLCGQPATASGWCGSSCTWVAEQQAKR